MRLTEPVTALTDYALSVAGLAFAVCLGRSIRADNRVSRWLWCAAFVASAVAAAAGGTFHGFAVQLAPGLRTSLWNLTMFSIGASAALVAAGVHTGEFKRGEAPLRWLVSGGVTTITGIMVQQSRFRQGVDFNHNDAYHVIQLLALYLLFLCARMVRDRAGAASASMPRNKRSTPN